jgi:hypothetical protein
MSRRYCPVCWQTVGMPTAGGHIADHFDSVGRDVCPISGEPYELAGYGRRRIQIDREYVEPAELPEGTAADTVTTLRMDRLERLLAS